MSGGVDLKSQVRHFLDKNISKYERFLDEVINFTYDLRLKKTFSGKIYRIYDRGAKQKGQRRIKTDEGILKAFKKLRSDNQSAKINDIEDIIGLTVVVYFMSDIDPVVTALKAGIKGELICEKHKTKRDNGYYAEHLVFRTNRGPAGISGPIYCEVQVKSLLHDGWATKTHDLSYKSKRVLNKSINNHISLIGDSILIIEKQSDSLKKMIERAIEVDAGKRSIACNYLSRRLFDYDSSEHRHLVEPLFDSLSEHEKLLSECEVDHPVFTSLVERWGKLKDQIGYCGPICRFIVALAAIRSDDDLDADAIYAVDEWISLLKDSKSIAVAMNFRSVSSWMLGDIEDAIHNQRETMSFAKSNGFNHEKYLIDLCYYMADYIFSNGRDGSERYIEFIDASMAEITSFSENHAINMDSVGAVKIMYSDNREDVDRGLEICRMSRNISKKDPNVQRLFDLFFNFHLKRHDIRVEEMSSNEDA
ncbi:MAG: hypothetical protein B7X99_18955 [Rhizobiales bacterium 17-65-6]|nr:MAG: hypothetical protein B7X99_18955 [Rhizobiales bacterium 17-65-6]